MKKMKKILASVLTLALCFSLFIPFAAGENAAGEGDPIYLYGNTKMDGFDPGKTRVDFLCSEHPDEEIFDTIWYAAADLPDGIEYRGKEKSSGGMQNTGGSTTLAYGSLYLDKERSLKNPEKSAVTKWALEFVSGDKSLLNAVRISQTDTVPLLSLKGEWMPRPGEATFRLTLENNKYFYQEEKTLRVVSAREEPPIVNSKVPVTIHLDAGKTYYTYRILDLIVSEIACNAPQGSVSNLYGRNYEKIFGGIPQLKCIDKNLKVLEPMDETVTMYFQAANLIYPVPVRISTPTYGVLGSQYLQPGEQALYQALTYADRSKGSASWTWSLEGEGAKIDPKLGIVTVDKNLESGGRLLVIATPDDGSIPTSFNIFTIPFGFPNLSILQHKEQDGFTYPLPTGFGWSEDKPDDESNVYLINTTDSYGTLNQLSICINTSHVFVHDGESAREHEKGYNFNGYKYTQSREIGIDGAPAFLYLYAESYSNGLLAYRGCISYPRNNSVLSIYLTRGRVDTDISDLNPFTFEELTQIAQHIHYDETKAPLSLADVSVRIDAGSEAPVVSAGKKLQLKALFGNEEKVNAKQKNNGIVWQVADAATGSPTEAASIDAKGVLTVSKNLEQATALRVTATSETYGIGAAADVTAIPAATKMETDRKELTLYAADGQAETVRVVLTPENVPAIGLNWNVPKEGVIELTPGEDGTAVIKAVAAGSVTVSVTEPGGKKATVAVKVIPPVEDLELTFTGKQTPGSTVTVKADILPKNAGDKTIEWSLDVSEDVATISKNGAVKISKDAAPGTVITVTCRATGAPVPVEKTVIITVE